MERYSLQSKGEALSETEKDATDRQTENQTKHHTKSILPATFVVPPTQPGIHSELMSWSSPLTSLG